MKFLSIIVVISFIISEEVDVLSVPSTTGNEMLKVSLRSIRLIKKMRELSTYPWRDFSVDGSSSAPLKRIMNVFGIVPSYGIIELLESRLEADNLEYAEDALLKIYQILNIDLPTCDHLLGSKQALLLQMEGIRNKTKELEIYDALISIKQLLKLMEDGFLFSLGLLNPNTRIINDGLENATDSVHYLRWKRFFEELPYHAEIKKIKCVFGQNISRIDNFCRSVDKIFSYSYGGIEFASTGMYIECMRKCKTTLLRFGEMYALEINVADVLIRLQSKDKELYALFNAHTEDPHNRLGKLKRTELFDKL